MNNGGREDFEAKITEAWKMKRCAECGTELDPSHLRRSVFCSSLCSTRFGDRRRYHANLEASRARARDYYYAHREEVLARQAARYREAARPREPRTCSECDAELTGRQRVVCSRRCAEARFRRSNPEGYAKREAAKVERRREKRRAQREDRLRERNDFMGRGSTNPITRTEEAPT